MLPRQPPDSDNRPDYYVKGVHRGKTLVVVGDSAEALTATLDRSWMCAEEQEGCAACGGGGGDDTLAREMAVAVEAARAMARYLALLEPASCTLVLSLELLLRFPSLHVAPLAAFLGVAPSDARLHRVLFAAAAARASSASVPVDASAPDRREDDGEGSAHEHAQEPSASASTADATEGGQDPGRDRTTMASPRREAALARLQLSGRHLDECDHARLARVGAKLVSCLAKPQRAQNGRAAGDFGATVRALTTPAGTDPTVGGAECGASSNVLDCVHALRREWRRHTTAWLPDVAGIVPLLPEAGWYDSPTASEKGFAKRAVQAQETAGAGLPRLQTIFDGASGPV